MAGEVVAGLIGNSLALLADAGHMLTDGAALVFALVASSMSARPGRPRIASFRPSTSVAAWCSRSRSPVSW
jgi:Co/Zn/Cd efflux system component